MYQVIEYKYHCYVYGMWHTYKYTYPLLLIYCRGATKFYSDRQEGKTTTAYVWVVLVHIF